MQKVSDLGERRFGVNTLLFTLTEFVRLSARALNSVAGVPVYRYGRKLDRRPCHLVSCVRVMSPWTIDHSADPSYLEVVGGCMYDCQIILLVACKIAG